MVLRKINIVGRNGVFDLAKTDFMREFCLVSTTVFYTKAVEVVPDRVESTWERHAGSALTSVMGVECSIQYIRLHKEHDHTARGIERRAGWILHTDTQFPW